MPSSNRKLVTMNGEIFWQVLPVQTEEFRSLQALTDEDLTSYSNIAAVYTDGGVISKNPSEIGGTWAYRFVDKDGNVIETKSGIVFPNQFGMDALTNNFTEFYAMLMAYESLPEHWYGDVFSDSEITLGRFFHSWKHEGIPVELITRAILAKRTRTARQYTLLAGHPSKADLAAGTRIKRKSSHMTDEYPVAFYVSEHNKACDEECNAVAHRYLDSISMFIAKKTPEPVMKKTRKITVV